MNKIDDFVKGVLFLNAEKVLEVVLAYKIMSTVAQATND